MFENMVLRRIFGPERDEVAGEWRKLHNYSSPNIRVIKSRRMRWAGYVERVGRREARTGFWCRNLRERDHLKDLGLDGFLRCGIGGTDWFDLA